ncbi:hypothetical protein BH24ACT16_BH24ACT16_07660 [soil metagenome]|jgi:hypothetical protein
MNDANDSKGELDLPGLTAQEIWDSHFRNELDEEEKTESIATAAGFLVERGFDVWKYREPVPQGTVWSDGLGKTWLVDPASDEIAELDE